MAAWIFQGNPDLFDVDACLRDRQEIRWLMNQGNGSVQIGDEVYIWRAEGKKKAVRGIVGHGKILSFGEMADDCPEKWYLESPGTSYRARIALTDVRLTPGSGMIEATKLQSDPLLVNSAIVTSRTETNFRLSKDQARCLSQMWNDPGNYTHRL